MKINLGCCDSPMAGYLNIDLNKDLKGVLPANALYLPFKNDSIDEIYASHFIEHLTFKELDEGLKEWRRVLKPGGMLHVVVPDLGVLAKMWDKADVKKKIHWLNPAMFGSHRGPGQVHKCGLDSTVLMTILLDHKFMIGACWHSKEWNFWLEVKAYKEAK